MSSLVEKPIGSCSHIADPGFYSKYGIYISFNCQLRVLLIQDIGKSNAGIHSLSGPKVIKKYMHNSAEREMHIVQKR